MFDNFGVFSMMMLGETWITLIIVFFSTLFSCLFGLVLGVLLVVTSKNGITPRPNFNTVLGGIVNIGRSIPFIILMVAVMPFTRMITGSAIGIGATVVPLVIAAIPFVARVAESSLLEIDSGMIEAAQSMGSTARQIIFKVMLPESVPSLIMGLSLTTITIIGYTAMAGVVGGGGLGDLAVRWGYQRYRYDVLIAAVIILVIVVQIIQSAFNFLTRRLDKRISPKVKAKAGLTAAAAEVTAFPEPSGRLPGAGNNASGNSRNIKKQE